MADNMRLTREARTLKLDGMPAVTLARWDGTLPDGRTGPTISGAQMDEAARYVGDAVQALSSDAAHLLVSSMAAWRAQLDELDASRRDELVSELDAIVERAARLRAYVDAYNPDFRFNPDPYHTATSHTFAVKASNTLAAKVRKALGYTYSRQDVTF
jgi:hypothetical protein